MVATHFYCPQCAAVQPAAIGPLIPGERGLGAAVRCAHCAHLAFTMLKAARIYCGVCDDVQPAVLKSVGASDAKVLVCGSCLNAKATLYGERRIGTAEK
jgi:hypothetical protein